MPELGRAALVATLGLALYAVVAGASRPRTRAGGGSPLSAQNALIARLRDDGRRVRSSCSPRSSGTTSRSSTSPSHTSRELPTGYTISAFWGGQEGSLLLWLLVLTGYSAAAVLLNRRRARDLVAWVVPVLGARRASSSRSCSSRSRRRSRRRRRPPTARA